MSEVTAEEAQSVRFVKTALRGHRHCDREEAWCRRPAEPSQCPFSFIYMML